MTPFLFTAVKAAERNAALSSRHVLRNSINSWYSCCSARVQFLFCRTRLNLNSDVTQELKHISEKRSSPMGDDRFSLICLSSWVTSLFKLSRVRQKRNWTRAEQHEYQELMEFRRTCRLDKAAFLSAAFSAGERKRGILPPRQKNL